MTFYDIKQAAQYLNAFEGKVIGVTSGCYDLLHPLHILYLTKCKRECDILLVQLDSDFLTFRNKKRSPYINEVDRAFMADNIKCVDCTMIINEIHHVEKMLKALDTSKNKIKNFKNSDIIYGKPAIRVEGVDLVIIPDVLRFNSTTEIREFLKSSSNEPTLKQR
jgi:cytidyltransferase-like protein